ncbi:FHA domain-containing protein [Georgenia sp. H159]|uniref:FHA domain-containing protein n=1 Tax=Georgenia sp. H159 TaxID=3076115 RepID=UPI002D76CCCE|nr:FHA domain-containing protein [Georgenia sp. H159]
MSVPEYQSGQWTALVTQDALALLHPAVSDDVARELWQLTSTGKRLGAWVEYLAAAGIAALPSFAMVEAHPEGLRVLVRGEVDVELGDRVVSGRGYATWREEVLPASDVTIRAESADGGWLPVAGGIVRAASARLVVQAPPAPAAEEEDDDVELTIARMPALAAAVGGRTSTGTGGAAAAVAGAAGGVPASDGPPGQQAEPASAASTPAASGAPAEPAPAIVHDTPVPAAAEPEPTAPAEAAAMQAADDDATAMADPSGAVLPGEDEEEDADDYDFLLWSTEQVRARESTPEPAPPAAAGAPEPAAPSDDPADPVPVEPGQVDIEATRDPEPEPTDSGWAPGGIIDSVPGRPHPAPPAGPPVDGPTPLAGAAHDDGDHDGETIATSELPSVDVPTALEPATRPAPDVELVLSTGPRIEMDRPVLLGRAPEAARFAGAEAPRLVSVSNPERDISATHVEVRPAGGHVVVTDMNSTNGTVVHLPDQPSFRLQPGTGVPVGTGAVIELGVGVTATVQHVEGAQ